MALAVRSRTFSPGPFAPGRSAPGRRPLAKAAGAAAVAAMVSAACASCTTSSPVATVNGHAITQSEFDQQLEAMAASPSYVKAFNTQQAENAQEAIAQAEQSGQSTAGIQAITLQGTATGPDNYSLEWAVLQLNRIVNGEAVSQYLARAHRSATPQELTAAWDAEDAAQASSWRAFTPALRTVLAREDADHALIETKLTDAKTDKQFYDSHRGYFWSRVCVAEVDVSVAGANGGIDMPASKSQAEELAHKLSSGASLNSATAGAGGAAQLSGGSYYCLGPEQLNERSLSYVQGVGELAVGKAAAVAGPDGYQVVLVRSRNIVPLNRATEGVVDVVIALGGFQGDGYNDTPLINVLKQAKVQVNPQYGAWDSKPPSPYAPQDLSPRQLLSS